MKTIDIKFPYLFTVSGVPARGKNTRTTHCYSTFDASIPVITADEAPICAIVPCNIMTTEFIADQGEVVFRNFEGTIYSKCLTSVSNQRPAPAQLDSFLDFMEKGREGTPKTYPLRTVFNVDVDLVNRALFGSKNDYNPIIEFKEEQWKSFTDNKRELHLSVAQHHANSLLVIDGEFWQSTEEPVYALNGFRDREFGSHAYLTLTTAKKGAVKAGVDRLFGLTESELINYVIMSEDKLSPIEDHEFAKIIDEEMFAVKNINLNAFRIVGKIVNDEFSRLRTADVNDMISWAKFRDEFDRLAALPVSDDSVSDVLEAAASFAGMCSVSEATRKNINAALNRLDFTPSTVISRLRIPSA